MISSRSSRAVALALLAIVAACRIAGETAARSRRLTLELEPLGHPGAAGEAAAAASQITALRLVEAGGPHLLASEHHGGGLALRLSKLVDGAGPGELAATSEAGRPLPALAGVPGPVPEWDAGTHADGSASAVWTIAGSAVSHLMFRNTGEPDNVTVNAATPFGVFGVPHLIRPDAGPGGAIVSIALIDDQPKVVVFRRGKTGAFVRYQPIDVAWRGVPVDAKLVSLGGGGGGLLFVKVLVPGSVPPDVGRRPGGDGETLGAGLVDAVSLDHDLHPDEPVTRPLGDELVFELDAAPLGARVAVLATTPAGATLALCDTHGHPAPTAAKKPDGTVAPALRPSFEIPSHEPLTSPALLVVGAHLYAAALRAAATPAARVVAAKVDPSGL